MLSIWNTTESLLLSSTVTLHIGRRLKRIIGKPISELCDLANMPVMSTESAGDDQQATVAVTIKHETSSGNSMHQLLSNSVSAATASSGGGLGGIVGSEHSPSPTTLCGGCGFKITDRYYLVAVERAWHSECLRCGECRRPLDTALSCFARQSRIYCRDDYYR